MNQPINLEEIAQEIRTLYRSDPEQGRASIEKYLEERLGNLSPPDRVAQLDRIKDRFGSGVSPVVRTDLETPLIQEFVSLVLGRKVTPEEFESRELLDRLIESLNTVFDSLNEVIGVIQSTLLGRSIELRTIRWVIGSHLEGGGETLSLESYLNQIKEAFLVAHKAFKEAAGVKLQLVLKELDPEAIGEAAGGGLKIGARRRAELFDIYQARFERIKEWFNSGRFMEELVREFEKVCQNIYADKGGHGEKLF